jgi:site-specific DNA-cytosine methylase
MSGNPDRKGPPTLAGTIPRRPRRSHQTARDNHVSQLRHTLDTTPELSLDQITEADLMNTRFRMFEPDPELRRAMAFDDKYILLGNKTQMTFGLGNAVTPPLATWITGRCLATLAGALVN